METSSVLIDTSILVEHFRKKNKSKSTLYQLPPTFKPTVPLLPIFKMHAGAMDEESSQYLDQLFDSVMVLELTTEISHIASRERSPIMGE